MAKTPIKEWEPIGIPTGRRYKREDFEAILEATRLDLSWRGKLRLRHGTKLLARADQVTITDRRKPRGVQVLAATSNFAIIPLTYVTRQRPS